MNLLHHNGGFGNWIFTCSELDRFTEGAVANTIRGFNGKIESFSTFKAVEGAGDVSAVAVEHLSTLWLGKAKVFHSPFAHIPRQSSRASLTVKIDWKTGGLTRNCQGAEKAWEPNRKLIPFSGLCSRTYWIQQQLMDFWVNVWTSFKLDEEMR